MGLLPVSILICVLHGNVGSVARGRRSAAGKMVCPGLVALGHGPFALPSAPSPWVGGLMRSGFWLSLDSPAWVYLVAL